VLRKGYNPNEIHRNVYRKGVLINTAATARETPSFVAPPRVIGSGALPGARARARRSRRRRRVRVPNGPGSRALAAVGGCRGRTPPRASGVPGARSPASGRAGGDGEGRRKWRQSEDFGRRWWGLGSGRVAAPWGGYSGVFRKFWPLLSFLCEARVAGSIRRAWMSRAAGSPGPFTELFFILGACPCVATGPNIYNTIHVMFNK
jgi:hypothetical protein